MERLLKNLILKILRRLLIFIEKNKTQHSIETSQRVIAHRDGQELIYSKSGVNTLAYDNHLKLRKHCIESVLKEGFIFEFGVYKAKSINYFAEKLVEKNDHRIVYGFDSFEGFSEEWSGVNNQYDRKVFNQDGLMPDVKSNVVLIPGFIENTLKKFVIEKSLKEVAFIHIDTDTYSPAKHVLSTLKPYLKSGSIILFDELCGYPNWRNHEFRALNEVFNENEYEYLGFAKSNPKSNLIKAAIRIL